MCLRIDSNHMSPVTSTVPTSTYSRCVFRRICKLVDQIFDVLVRDFSHFALALHNKASSTPQQMTHCLRMLHKPARDDARYQRVWEGQVLPQADRYAMNP